MLELASDDALGRQSQAITIEPQRSLQTGDTDGQNGYAWSHGGLLFRSTVRISIPIADIQCRLIRSARGRTHSRAGLSFGRSRSIIPQHCREFGTEAARFHRPVTALDRLQVDPRFFLQIAKTRLGGGQGARPCLPPGEQGEGERFCHRWAADAPVRQPRTSSSPEHPANSEIGAVPLRASVGGAIVIGAAPVGHRRRTTPSARPWQLLAGTALTAARR
jgi:hypothetical protein